MTGADETGRDEHVPAAPPAAPPPPPSEATGWGHGPTGPTGYGQQPPGQAPPPPPPGYGAPQYGAPQHGAPQHGAPQYPPPQHGAPQYPPPQYGAPQYPPPQYGAPQYGAPGGPAYGYGPGAPGYPSAAQPGVVPLRPLSLGELFDGSFKSVRANPKVMFGLSAVVVLVATALGIIAQFALLPTVARTVAGGTAEIDPTGEFGLAESTASVLALLGALPFTFLAVTVLTGLLTASVSQSVIGRRITAAELWSRYWKRCVLLIVFSVLLQVAALLPWGALAGVVYLLVSGGQEGWAIAVGLGLALVIVVVTVWVYVRTLLVPPALVLEGTGFGATIARAWRLSRGSFWRILGIYLLATIVISLVAQVVVVPVTMVVTIMGMDPLSLTYVAVSSMANALATWLSTVFLAALVALLYIDVRIRREGLDVTLARAAEQAANQASAR